MSTRPATAAGYLPQDRPPFGAMLTLGLQHVLAMFPATVFVAIVTKFGVGVTLFASGLAIFLFDVIGLQGVKRCLFNLSARGAGKFGG